MKINKIIVFLGLFCLSACATPEQLEARKRMQEEADHAECVNMGFRPKTDAYGDCRLRLKEMRFEASRPVYYPSVGIGYGHHFGRYHRF